MRTGRTKDDSRPVAAAYRDWLDQYRWHHFCTLTFKQPCTAAFVRRAFLWFAKGLERLTGSVPYWFWAMECGASPSLPHLHALLGNTSNLAVDRIAAAWRLGLCRVTRYDPRRRAAAYLTKAIMQAASDYDLSEQEFAPKSDAD